MERQEIIERLSKYFQVKELVCNHIYAKFKEKSWRFKDTMYLHCLLVMRTQIFKRPMYCNYKGMTQRGMRCNLCKLVSEKVVVYVTSHLLGKAGDWDIEGLTAEEARQMVKDNADLLPCKIRIEDGVNWLHFDVVVADDQEEKVYVFKG